MGRPGARYTRPIIIDVQIFLVKFLFNWSELSTSRVHLETHVAVD